MEQSVTVDIAAPPERVWEVLSDVEYWSEWTPTVTVGPPARRGPAADGEPAEDSASRASPRPSTSSPTSSRGAPSPGSRRGRACSPPPATTPSRCPDGGTRVRLSVSQSGWLASLMGRFYRGLTDRYLANEANGLKARCEKGI